MSFIADVIYNLKREYGKQITVGNVQTSVDYGTGKKQDQRTENIIPLAVVLPTTLSESFLRSLGVNKVGAAEYNRTQILIDKADLEITIEPENYVILDNKYYIVKSVENDLEEALILNCMNTSSAPVSVRDLSVSDTLTINESHG